MRGRPRHSMHALLWAVIATALHSSWVSAGFGLQTSSYIVTVEPIRVTDSPGGLCIAIDASGQAGIWWWGPGRSGCSSRNTTPGPRQENAKGLAALFHAERAAVSSDSSGTVHASFRLGLHGPPAFIDVELFAQAGRIRYTPTGAEVPTTRLSVLDIPFEPPR
jgi:hypothetical protein